MKCPKCQFENREEAKFCSECGYKFELICPECGTSIRSGSKFCDGCGYNLEPAKETSAVISEIETLPFQSTAEQSSPDIAAIVGERKHVTVLFSDLIGYTEMSERFDPEDVKDITTHIFDEVSKIVAKYDGFIEKFAGDAVMALFGAKKAHEDDPVRAIHAAREIHNVVNTLSPKYEKIIEQPLSMHTGINTGLVVTGDVNLEKGTHGVAGDTINVASRLSSLGNADEILVGPSTFRQAEGYFEFNELEPTIVKGKSAPIQIYKVLSIKAKPVKIHRLHGLRADLIGRKVEINQLADAAQGLIKDKKGSVISISGPAGTGKSRLIEEFRSSLSLEEIQWLEGHAYPYSQNIPYYPLIDLLSKALLIEEGDPPEKVKEKVETGVSRLIGGEINLMPYIGSLFSISYPEIEEVSPEFWKAQLQKAVQTTLASLSQRVPMIICLEDLHWADPSFLELIRLILAELRHPIFFLCTFRPVISLFPSHQISNMVASYHEIRLQDLSPTESQIMVESLLKTDSIPTDLQHFVQDKIEGNPFYIEEVINSLIESETLIRDNGNWKVIRPISEADISSTIHGVISGRLDRLENETKRILQEASVIGRSFLYEILERITELKGQIDKCLSGLERLDLIKTRMTHPDLEYIFKHALTQEVVYNGLLKKDRREIHERIGLVIEQLFHDRLTEFYETLAYHFRLGKSLHKAINYLIKSGEKSLKRYALEEANNYYTEAFELLSNKSDKSTKENELIIDLIIKWAYVYYYKGDIKGWTELFLAHKTLVESLPVTERVGMFFAWLGFSFLGNDNRKSLLYLQETLKIGEELQNQKIIGYANTWLPFTYADLGLLDQAIQCGNKAQEIANQIATDQYLLFKSLAGLGVSYWNKGEVKGLHKVANKLIKYGQQYSNIRSQSMGYMALGGVYNLMGNFQQQNKYFQKAIEVSSDPWYDHIAKTYLSLGYILSGQFLEAEKLLSEVAAFSNQNHTDWIGTPGKVFQGIVMVAKGSMSRGLKMIEEALATFKNKERKFYICFTEHVLGKIYLQIIEGAGPLKPLILVRNIGFLLKNVPFADKKAESHLNKAIEIAVAIGAKSILAPAYLDLGLLHKAKKRYKQAMANILKATDIFEEWEAEIYLQQAKEALKALE